MEVLAAGASWLLGSSFTVPWLSYFTPTPNGNGDPYGILQELRPLLSPNASIHLPSSLEFAANTDRWISGTLHPSFFASVEVATEKDVQLSVEFANCHGIPFLAHTGGHAIWQKLSALEDGLQIYMRNLNTLEINEDTNTATIGGGIIAHEVIEALYAEGKQAVTGLCPCVSLVGPALGGGHGLLQGRYGFMADNLISARMVLGNGSVVDISQDSHPDLYWGIRGAGHNFGIVTSLEYKIYDIPENNQWVVTNYFFKQEKLESLLEIVNGLTEIERPVELLEWGLLRRVPDIDPDNAVIHWTVQWEGPESDASAYRAPVEALGPITTTTTVITEFNRVLDAMGYSMDSVPCQRTYDSGFMTISLQRFNTTASRKMYNIFNEATKDPSLAYSFVMLEGYANNAAKAVPDRETAVSREERQSNFLVGGATIILPRGDPEAQKRADAAASAMKAALAEGLDPQIDGPPHSYINYAFGEESAEELYGYDEWRLQRLRDLKRRYDPEGRFNHYGPIFG